MVLLERIRSHGKVDGAKETSVEAELSKEIESCGISKNEMGQIVRNAVLFFVLFGLLCGKLFKTYMSQRPYHQPTGRNGPSSSHNGPDQSNDENDRVSTAGTLNTT